MSSPYKTFSIQSFGCKVNFADSSFISSKLIENGLSLVKESDIADIYILNTCSVTENADKKANKYIKYINAKSPSSRIIVTGCYAQLKADEISALPGVDAVIGMESKFDIEKYIESHSSSIVYRSEISNSERFDISYSLNERTRSFVKIQDGCNYTCSYCTIPNARGKSRSQSIEKTLDNIKGIVKSGVKEIILSGINVGDFGIDNENLYQLLLELEKIKELERYRISSIEPNLLSDEIIDLISVSNKILPHLHIPLQSGSDKILKLMKRRYNSKYYFNLIDKIVKKIPNICIGVDVIVGFPNENHEDFIKTYNLLNDLKVSYLHVFSYSERKNTEAEKIKEKVSKNEIVQRRKKLQELSNSKNKNYIFENLNTFQNVLFENYENGYLSGLTENYIRVYVKSEKNHKNKIKKVKLIKNTDFVYGEMYE